jgi:hypothetical protein
MFGKFPPPKLEPIFTKWGYLLYMANGIISLALFGSLLYFEVTAMDSLKLSIIVGLCYPALMRSRVLTARITETNIPIGFEIIQQNLEEFFKHKMNQEYSYKYTIVCSRLDEKPIELLEKWAMDVVNSSGLKSNEIDKKLQKIKEIMNDNSSDDDKKRALSGGIVGVGGLSYANKLSKMKNA